MTNNFTKYSFLNNQFSRHRHFNNCSSILIQAFICALCYVFCVLFFSACATVPDSEDIKKAEAYNKLGVSYLNNDQLNEAFIKFQEAIKLNPENKETLNYLGYISVKFNKYEEAISYYKRAISIDPNYSEAINNLGVAYAEIENWDEAIKYFKAALSNLLYRTPERAYLNMGYAYYMKGDYQSAENALKEALMRNPVFPLAMYTLGLVYIELGNDEAAIKEFKRTIGIMSDYIDAHWELAKIYFRLGEKGKALKHFEVVAEKDENTERHRKALEYIEIIKYNIEI